MTDKRQWRILVDTANRIRRMQAIAYSLAVKSRARGDFRGVEYYTAQGDAFEAVWHLLGRMVRGEL